MSDNNDDADGSQPRTDQIRIVGAQAAGDLAGFGDDDVEDEGGEEEGGDSGDRGLLRFPRPRSVFESIPDAPESLIEDEDEPDERPGAFDTGYDPHRHAPGDDDRYWAPPPEPPPGEGRREPQPGPDRGFAERRAAPDADRFGRIPVIRMQNPDPSEELDLPHWTEPPTGQVPKVLGGDVAGDEGWSSYGSSPRWRDPSTEWETDDYGDVADLRDEMPRMGALDENDRPALDDFFAFDDLNPDDRAPSGRRSGPQPTVPVGRAPVEDAEEAYAEEYWAEPAPQPRAHAEEPALERSVPVAIGVGVTVAAVALIALMLGPTAAMVLVTVVIALGAAEFFAATRRAGHTPAVLIGLAASVALPLAVYWRGVAAYPLLVFLTVVTGLLWYVLGVDHDRPLESLGITLVGFGYVGGLGSFAALTLRLTDVDGTDVLLAAIIPTVVGDVFAFVVGRNAGRSPLSPISPHKTVEGLLGGMAGAVIGSLLFNNIILGLAPFDTVRNALALGVVVAVMSPLGDLSESLIKRDLGVKDMGTLFPGHGGALDRFDTLLFVVPATYFLGLFLDLYAG